VRQRGKETYKLKLTNKNYKNYNRLESGKQVVGPISVQTLVDCRLGECSDKRRHCECSDKRRHCECGDKRNKNIKSILIIAFCMS
jgi:hypothetical protein